MVSTTEIAWAAGLFDGEGSVRNLKSRHYMISVQLTDLPMLERFHRAVSDIGTISPPQHRKNRKTIWHWYACSQNAIDVADILLPYVDHRNHGRFTRLKKKFERDKTGKCEWCEEEFPRTHRDCRFCSDSCRCKAYRARKKREQITSAR